MQQQIMDRLFWLHVWGMLIASMLFSVSLAQERTAPVSSEKNYAFLFAVAGYQHAAMNNPKLVYPEADARSLGEVLTKAGYQVELCLGTNATLKNVRSKLRELDQTSDSNGAVILGFFGHGIELERSQEAYFCPYDTRMHEAKSLGGERLFDRNGQPLLEPNPDSLVSMAEIVLELRKCPAGNKFLLADCCRSDPNAARGRAFGSQVKLEELPENTAVLLACSSREKAFEHDDWQHGAFTKCLLQAMASLRQNANLNIASLASELKERVPRLVADKYAGRETQRPYILLKGLPSLGKTLGKPLIPWDPGRIEIFVDRWGANRTEAFEPIVSYSPDGRWIAAEGRIYDAASKRPHLVFEQLNISCHAESRFSSDSRYVLVENHLIDLTGQKLPRIFHPDPRRNYTFDQSLRFYASTQRDAQYKVESLAIKSIETDRTLAEFDAPDDFHGLIFGEEDNHIWIHAGTQLSLYRLSDQNSRGIARLEQPLRSIRIEEQEFVADVFDQDRYVLLTRYEPEKRIRTLDLDSQSTIASKSTATGFFEYSADQRAFRYVSRVITEKNASGFIPDRPTTLLKGRQLHEMPLKTETSFPREVHLDHVFSTSSNMLTVLMMETNCLPCGFYDSFHPANNGFFSIALDQNPEALPLQNRITSSRTQTAANWIACETYFGKHHSLLIDTRFRSKPIVIPNLHCLSGNGKWLLVSGKADMPPEDEVEIRREPVLNNETGETRLISTSDFRVQRSFAFEFSKAASSYEGNRMGFYSYDFSSTKPVEIRDMQTGQVLLEFQGKEFVHLTGDGKFVMVMKSKVDSSQDNEYEFWSIDEKKVIKSFSTPKYRDEFCVLSSARGDRVLVDNAIYETTSWRKLQQITRPQDHARPFWSHDERHVIWLCPSGELVWTDTQTGQEVVRLLLANNGKSWVITTPDLLFDASPDMRQHVYFRQRGAASILPSEEIPEQSYTPGLLQKALKL